MRGFRVPSLDDFLRQEGALPSRPDVRRRQHPKGWEPGVAWDGASGTLTTEPVEAMPDWDSLLQVWGLDPSRYEVDGTPQFRAWDGIVKNKEGFSETKRLFYYKATIRERSRQRVDDKELARLFKRPPRKTPTVAATGRALVVGLSDFQLGKSEGGGTAATVERLVQKLAIIDTVLRDATKRKEQYEQVVLACMGDLIEGCSGHYAMQTFQVDLDRREQERVTRRVLGEYVRRIAPLTSRLIVAAVPGNHGECFDEGTELLTVNGWKRVDKFNGDETIATLNPTSHAFEWQRIEGWTSYQYDGPMIRLAGRSGDLLVTPNHDLYAARKQSGGWGQTLATRLWSKNRADKELKSIHMWMHGAASWTGVRPDSVVIPAYVDAVGRKKADELVFDDLEAFVSFMGWYVSEGSCCSGIKGEKDFRIVISQSERVNPEKYAEIGSLLQRLGFNAVGRDRSWRFSHVGLAVWLRDNFGESSGTKRLPAWFKDLPSDLLERFLTSYFDGDGHAYSETGVSVKSKSRRLADDLQEIGLKTGRRASIGLRRAYPVAGSDYVGSAVEFYLNKRRISEQPKPVVVDYSGMVYCPTVANGLVFARRNGKVVVSGNSRQNGKAFTTWSDNSDLSVVEGVAEIVKGREGYEHVSFVIADRLTLTLDVCGVIVGLAHGHAGRVTDASKLARWWGSHALSGQPIGDAQILITGHYHHLKVDESTGRTWIQVPAMDGGSAWWTESSGQHSHSGMMIVDVGAAYGQRGWNNVRVI